MDGFKTASCKSFDFEDIHMSFNNDVMSIISLQDCRGSGEQIHLVSSPKSPIQHDNYDNYDYFLNHYPTLKNAYKRLFTHKTTENILDTDYT